DESSDVEELDIAKDAPLAVVVLEIEASWEAAGSISAKEKLKLDHFVVRLELSKRPDSTRNATAHSKAGEGDKPWLFDLCSTGRGWDKDLVVVRGNYDNAKEEDPYQLQRRISNPTPSGRSLMNLRDYINELINSGEEWVNCVFNKLGIKRKRQKKKDSLLRNVPVAPKLSKKRGDEEAQLEEHARATAASMATLYGTDPDKAGRQMKKTMHQAVDNLELARGTEASQVSEIKILKREQGTIREECERRLDAQRYNHTQILQAKLAEKDKVMKEQRETIQGQFDEECETTIRLKTFIEALGRCSDRGVRSRCSSVVLGGGVEEAAAGTVTDKVADATVSNPSTEGTGGVGTEEPVGGDGVATPI
ncbi:hypothetical protein GIB67_027579, partial [Kingdonia uniflora]